MSSLKGVVNCVNKFHCFYLTVQYCKQCTKLYRRLGLPSYNHYGAGSGPIWLNNLQCTRSERSLAECRHDGWGVTHRCHHTEDVSIICANSKCTQSSTHLFVDSVLYFVAVICSTFSETERGHILASS